MRIAQVLAGISLAEADVLRKAVGKKDAELIRQELGKFIEKAVARGYDRRIIEEIASQIETFGRYGFNKSHSVAYSILSFQTAWLKVHYPAEFMAALLSSQIGDTDAVVKYINEAREMGIEVLPPDVNESGYKFTVVGDKRVRFGLGAIRNVGRTAIDAHSRRAPRWSVHRARRPRRPRRPAHLQQARVRGADRLRRPRWAGRPPRTVSGHARLDAPGGRAQTGGNGQRPGVPLRRILGQCVRRLHPRSLAAQRPTLVRAERLAKEKEILGFYISGHPLEPYRTEVELFASHTVAQLGTWTDQPIKLGVVVTAIKRQVSKRSGAEFARLTVEDFSGSSEVLVFPEAWTLLGDKIQPDVPVLLAGQLFSTRSGSRESRVHRRVGYAVRPEPRNRKRRRGHRVRLGHRRVRRRDARRAGNRRSARGLGAARAPVERWKRDQRAAPVPNFADRGD